MNAKTWTLQDASGRDHKSGRMGVSSIRTEGVVKIHFATATVVLAILLPFKCSSFENIMSNLELSESKTEGTSGI